MTTLDPPASTMPPSSVVEPTPPQPTQFRKLKPGPGRWVIARKEFSDHLLSGRFVVLIAVLAVAAAAAVFAASGGIREVAEGATEVPGLFLRLFTVTTDPVPFPFVTFIGFLGPLLGIMFGFDTVIGERAQGTLPRLMAQPLHRDEVIMGKFIAGLAIIGLMLTALTAFVSGIGIFRLGLVPSAAEIIRLLVWLLITIGYVGLWLAIATLLSVAVKRAATSALIATGGWLILSLFGSYIYRAIGSFIGGDDPTASLRAELWVSRISPLTLFDEASSVLLDPTTRATGLITLDQIDRAVLSNLTPLQSIIVVWPQISALLAMTAAAFAVAFIVFMRQDIRA